MVAGRTERYAPGTPGPTQAARDLSLSVGSIFQGGYEIVDQLGAGTFGRVYQARQLSTGQPVAIKILRGWQDSGRADVETQRERFRREMRLSAELSHPNIVRLIDSGESAEGTLYAVFEFVPGSTLKDILAAGGRLCWGETLHLMTQVLDALSCAHARGVVHRDLKPENIMVTRTGARRNALVLDFGLGGFVGEAQGWALPRLTATQEMMGTPCYAAPEQLRGEPPTTRSDLYSWGLIFLECLTGELAVGGGSAQDVLLKQLGPEPVRIPSTIGNRRLRRLLETVTAKPVERRNATIEGLLQELSRLEASALDAPSAAPDLQLVTEGERRQLTVICCGLGVASRDGSAPDLEDVDQLLHAQHALYEQLAGRSGGQLASVLADQVLLVFGYPHARENDARRAVHTALRIAAEVERANARLEAEQGSRLEVRIGVHTGLVIVHELRQVARETLPDLVGLTPRVATRLAGLAAPGEILVSPDTLRLLRNEFVTEPAGEHPVCEDGHRLSVFRVTGEQGPAAGAETMLRVRETPLVGRSHQLNELLDIWSGTAAKRGRTVLISGEPGIGKSRLLRELRRRVPARGWLECRCAPENQDTPLRPVADMLMAAEEPLESLLARYGSDLAESFPLLAAALSLPPNGKQLTAQLTPERQKELAFNALVTLFFRMAEAHPRVLALEDLHWADPTTLELLALLVREVEATPELDTEPAPRLSLVLTARPEFTPPWSLSDLSLIPLPRLTTSDVEEMVRAAIADGQSLPRGMLEEVIRHADGVPLFVEEVTRVLIETGILAEETQESATDGSTFEIPGTLRDLLAARLDALSPSARETAQLAAVLGREFRWELLRATTPKDETTLREDLRELTEAAIVFPRRSARAESYAFKHALVRDAAYETMVRATRQTTHLRVANTLRERFPDLERDRPEILAQHFEQGGKLVTAVEYWTEAGDRTMGRGAYAESIQLFEHGFALLGGFPESSERNKHERRLCESLGMALLMTRGFGAPEVEENFARALQLCDALGEPASLRTMSGVWINHVVRSDREATGRLLGSMRRRAEASRDPLTVITAHAWAGVRAFYAGEFVQACDEMTRGTEWYHTEEHRSFVEQYGYDGGIDAYAFLVWSLWIRGYPERALRVCHEMLSIADQTANPSALATALGFGANLARDRGDLERVFELTERSIALATEQKLYFWAGPAICTRGWATLQRGSVDDGIAQMRQGLSIYETLGVRATYAYHLSGLIEAHLKRWAPEEGLALVDDALAGCQTLLDCFYEAELHRLKGELLRLQDDQAEAETSCRTALDLARRQDARSFELRAAMSLGRMLRDQGRRSDAKSLLGGVYDWFSEGFDTKDLREAGALLAELS
jgi:TOMM system kinase/cyclase fusion protein